MRKVLFAVTVTAALLLAACSNEDKAHSLVKDFLSENLTTDYSVDSYQRFDSTKMVSKAAVENMRQTLGQIKMYGKKPQYANYADGEMLLYLRVKFSLDDDTARYVQTFYLDHNLTGVVAVKEN